MKILSAEHVEVDSQVFLLVRTDEGEFGIDDMQKFLREYGYPIVFLGFGAADVVEPIEIQANGIAPGVPSGNETLHGFSDDPTLVALARKFLADADADRVALGPVEIREVTNAEQPISE